METYYIYKLFYEDYCYIGSTTNLHKRLLLHKHQSKSYGTKCYCMMRELGGFEKFNCEVLDTIMCDKETSKKFENFYILKEQPQLNSNRSFATDEEKKQYLREYKKRRNLVNPDYKKNENRIGYERNKKHYNRLQPCACGKMVSPLNGFNHRNTKKHKKLIEQINQNI
jgi:hypothetical protein